MAGGKSTVPSWARNTGSSSGGGSRPRAGKNSTLPSWAGPSTQGHDTTDTVVVPATPHKSGGLLHELGHIASQTGTDLYNTAVHSPSGLYMTGKAVAEASAGNPQDLIKLGKAMGEGFVQDVQHPLRHPGNTLLDALAVASLGAGTAARIAEVGRAAEAGGTAADVLRAAAKGPKPEARTIDFQGTRVDAGTYSRSALKRSTQKLFDQFQHRFPDVNLRVVRTVQSRVGHELSHNRRIEDAVGRGVASPLAKVRLGKDARFKQVALQVAAEGIPVADRIHFHEQRLAELQAAGKTKLAAATRKKIGLLEGAKKYIDDSSGHPRITDPKLQSVYDMAHKIAMQREADLGNAERVITTRKSIFSAGAERTQALTSDVARGRLTKPAEVMGHTFDPQLVPELFRFPYKADQAKGALGKTAGYRGGNPVEPGTLTHEYTGALLKSGAFRNDTTRLVAESYLESHRFAALMKHRDEFLQLAHDERVSPHDIPIRADALKGKPWPKAIQDLSEQPALSEKEMETLGHYYETVRADLFPKAAEVMADERTLASGAHPDVKWIDERLLGAINKPSPLVGVSDPAAKAGLKAFDSVNNASRAAILYLKPAYGVPNLLGNAALNIVQQGWAAPVQIARSVRLWRGLDADTKAALLHAMGEGVAGALHAQAGPLSKSVNFLADWWQKPVDTPFRANAFLYEARRFGYKTPAQLQKLVKDQPELTRVAREASAAAIDYGNLGRIEQSIIRRAIFFYPWVKGSTQYAGRFLATHHTQAALLAQEGKQGAAKDAADLGALPSYMDGLFKVGDRGGNPLVLNPNSAGILQTPAQLAQTFKELGSKNPGEAFQFSQDLTPALQAGAALFGFGRQRNESGLQAIERELVAGLPLVTTAQGLRHPASESTRPRIYPRTRMDVFLHYLLGGLAPSPVNVDKAHQSAYLEKHPR